MPEQQYTLVTPGMPVIVEFDALNKHTTDEAFYYLSHNIKVWTEEGQPLQLVDWNMDLVMYGPEKYDPKEMKDHIDAAKAEVEEILQRCKEDTSGTPDSSSCNGW